MNVCINLSDRQYVNAWRNFIEYLERLSPQAPHSEWVRVAQSQLAQYEGWTDWADDADPIWFKDRDHLTQFVLTWS